MINFWIHITETKNNTYIQNIYNQALNEKFNQKNVWIGYVKYILVSLGMGHVWSKQSTLSKIRLKHALRKRLEEVYTHFWIQKKNENISRLQFYKQATANDIYRLEPYLTSSKAKLHRQALSKLRLSAHNLSIERGRHRKIPREDRKCSVCGVVEDEIHFLDNCTKFSNERKQFIDVVNTRFSGTLSNFIVSPSQALVIDELQECFAQYVFECFSL